MRKEIEVKAKVDDIGKVSQKLIELGCVLSDSVIQNDTIFVDDNYGEFDKFQPGKNLLRIRDANGKFFFTIKQPQSNEQDAIEYETEITNPKEMKEAILLMGYHEAIQVKKKRIKTKYNDWEICLDQVEGLPSSIEVEEIADDPDAGAVQDKLFNFLMSLGLKKEDRLTEGYDTMLY